MSPTDIDIRLAMKKLDNKHGNKWGFNIINKSEDVIKGEINIGPKTYTSTVSITDSFRNGITPVNRCFLQCYKKAGLGGDIFE